ncbi:MAG: class F sortase [bacterium]|nr:class F sortase [bacterium]
MKYLQKMLGLFFIFGGIAALFFGAYTSNTYRYEAPQETDAYTSSTLTPDAPDFATEASTRSVTSVAEALTSSAVAKPRKIIVSPPIQIPSGPRDPVRLAIPALSINARVQAVGVAPTGNIAAPQGFTDVGWYKYGARVGERGTVIIDGHVDNGLFRLGVFKHLDRSKSGDLIHITTGEGKRVTYTVSRIEVYNYKQAPMENIVHQKDIAQVVLITCAGNWIPSEKTYDRRLVVYATLTIL